MAKPWARVQVGYTRHPKFSRLNGNAFGLWHQIKDHCNEFHTDGLITHDTVKEFKFYSKKSMEMLLTPCGLTKMDGAPYAPLIERHPVGYKMHDFLDHNDCREEVLARTQRAEDEREASRQRVAKWREERRKADRRNAVTSALPNAPVTPPTEVTTDTEVETTKKKEISGEASSPPVLEFPTQGTPRSWALHQKQIDDWQAAYTSIDVKAECVKAREWLIATPAKRKTAGGMARFLVGWFNRAVERGGSPRVIAADPVLRPDMRGHVPPCRTNTECLERVFADAKAEREKAAASEADALH